MTFFSPFSRCPSSIRGRNTSQNTARISGHQRVTRAPKSGAERRDNYFIRHRGSRRRSGKLFRRTASTMITPQRNVALLVCCPRRRRLTPGGVFNEFELTVGRWRWNGRSQARESFVPAARPGCQESCSFEPPHTAIPAAICSLIDHKIGPSG